MLVKQIQEVQGFCINLANNIQIMPDLDDLLKLAKEKIASMQAQIDSVTLPNDVLDQLVILKNTLEDVDQRPTILQLQRDFAALKDRVIKNQIEVLSLQANFEKEVKGFQNKVWGTLEKLKKDALDKISTFEEKMTHLDAQLELQTSIEKINRLQTR
jgi:hypothetical protein